MIILGIDPGTATTGYGVIDYKKKKLVCIDYGVIETPAKTDMGERLKQLNFDLDQIIKKYKPEIAFRLSMKNAGAELPLVSTPLYLANRLADWG